MSNILIDSSLKECLLYFIRHITIFFINYVAGLKKFLFVFLYFDKLHILDGSVVEEINQTFLMLLDCLTYIYRVYVQIHIFISQRICAVVSISTIDCSFPSQSIIHLTIMYDFVLFPPEVKIDKKNFK